jgi:hypothetical protein
MDNIDRFLPTCVRTSPGTDFQSVRAFQHVRVPRVGAYHDGTLTKCYHCEPLLFTHMQRRDAALHASDV